MKLLTLLLLTNPAFAHQSVIAGTGSLTLPDVPQFQAIGNWRTAFRYHNFSAPGAGNTLIFSSNTIFIYHASDNTLNVSDANSSRTCAMSLAGRTDVIVRANIFTGSRWDQGGTGRILCEMWNSTTFDNRVQSLVQDSEIVANRYINGSVGFDFSSGRLAWLRFYNTTTDSDIGPPGTFDDQGTPILNWAFEGNGNESVGGYNVTLTGASFATTPALAPLAYPSALNSPLADMQSRRFEVTPPSVMVGGFRTGTAVTLTSGFSQADTAGKTYLWQQLSGPHRLAFSSHTTATTVVTPNLFGDYLIQLRVCDDNGACSNGRLNLGAVATGPNGVVVVHNANLSKLAGPLTRLGVMEWTEYDRDDWGGALNLSAAIAAAEFPYQTFDGPGTVAGTYANATIVGTGTTFQTTFNCDGSDQIVVRYPLAGGGFGTRAFSIQSCPSQTTLTLSPPGVIAWDAPSDPASPSGMLYGRAVIATHVAYWASGNTNWNYYDVVSAFVRLWLRTGLTYFLDAARLLDSRTWIYPLDEGRTCLGGRWACPPPRVWALTGHMMIAVIDSLDRWQGLYNLVSDQLESWTFPEYANNLRKDYDAREEGFHFWHIAQYCRVAPAGALKTSACALANQYANEFFIYKQHADGSWRFGLGGYTGDGTVPWHTIWAAYAMAELYDELGTTAYRTSAESNFNFTKGHRWCGDLTYTVYYDSGVICDFGPPFGVQMCTGKVDPCPTPATATGEMVRDLGQDTIRLYGTVALWNGLQTSAVNEARQQMSRHYGGRSRTGYLADGVYSGFFNTRVGTIDQLGKRHGYGAGSGASQALAGYLLGAVAAADNVTYVTPCTIPTAIYSTAAKLRITLTSPSGATAMTTCTSGTASLTIDRRFGTGGRYLAQRDYLTAGDAVIVIGTPQPVTIE